MNIEKADDDNIDSCISFTLWLILDWFGGRIQ